MHKMSGMSPQMKTIWLAFRARRALGLAKFGRPARPAAIPQSKWFPGAQILTSTLESQLVYEIRPASYRQTLIYLHGGGYVQPVSKFHWLLLGEIMRATETRIILPRYGLSPRHNVDHALKLLERVREQFGGGRLLLGGDSAGGGLALALAQQEEWQRALNGLLLISPWVDSEFSHPEIDVYNQRDPWLTPDALQYIANTWSAVGDFRRREVSPLRGEMTGLPKTQLFIGDHDLFYPDVLSLAEKLTAANIQLDFKDQSGGLHVYPLLPTPEGEKARREIVDWIQAG